MTSTTTIPTLPYVMNNWSIVNAWYDVDPYTPPELIPKHLHGNVEGHPNFFEGEEVTTSPIVKVQDGKIHTRSGSVYELGSIDPGYEKVFPNARARVLAMEQSSDHGDSQ